MIVEGLIAFPITPMNGEGVVDAQALRRLVARLVDARVDAICVLGSTGSYPFLSRESRRRAIDAAVAEVDGRTPVFAGVGALRTDHAVMHAQDAAAAGAVMGLLAPVSYTPLTDDEVAGHFATVAQDGGLPLCIYDNPASTHFAIGDHLVERLSRISNVVAAKSPSPAGPETKERVQAVRARTPPGFSVGFSGDANATEALIAGGDAWYSVLGGLFPAPLVAIRHAVRDGDIETARRIDQALQPMWALFGEYSGLRVVYAAANLTGLCEADPPLPIRPLPPAARARVAAVLAELGQVLGLTAG
ncbi:MAG: dihydrodipicolinate synthase family protein [Caulobacteraceae bacterium]